MYFVALATDYDGTLAHAGHEVTLALRHQPEITIEKVRQGGGSSGDKMPIPQVGWFAHCKDTEGNSFSLFQSDESVTG